jgi:3-deoxy-D-manno-octulosonic-acid transferase
LPCKAGQLSIGSADSRKYNRRVYFAYSLLLALALLLSAPWWLLEMVRHGKYREGLSERLGVVPDRLGGGAERETVWIHAVSVGEVLAVTRMVDELKLRLPGWRIVVSTTTDTGQKLARERFGESNVFYVPLDFSFAVNAYLRALRPRILVLAESEFWPNLLRNTHRAGASVAVVNARVSDRSLPRYLRFRGLLRQVMQNVDIFLAQSEEDARRLVTIGAPGERVQVGGNLKFEVKSAVASETVKSLSTALHQDAAGPVLVAGSTLEGEDELLLDCFRRMIEHYPSAVMVLAPRHPERFESVASLVVASGLEGRRRSKWDRQQSLNGCVFLLDSIGELASLYQYADLAFVGGSLVPKGGHNVLEAAQFGVPILVGSHTENFRDIVRIFQQADAIRVVTPKSLAPTVLNLLQDTSGRARLGQRALAVMRTQQGATEKTAATLLQLLAETSSVPKVETIVERRV